MIHTRKYCLDEHFHVRFLIYLQIPIGIIWVNDCSPSESISTNYIAHCPSGNVYHLRAYGAFESLNANTPCL